LELKYTNQYFSLRAKLKTISEQFDTRDLHYRGLLRSKDSEIQSLASKFEDQRRVSEVENNRCRALTSQVSTFSHTEAELRSQLNIYVEKFKQVRYKFIICGLYTHVL
jgi:CII-binding regulator of phage lambda lysogenization HflD